MLNTQLSKEAVIKAPTNNRVIFHLRPNGPDMTRVGRPCSGECIQHYTQVSITLYTIRSCSPSLRVVPSQRISFTNDKANIFSDLSLAVREEGKQVGISYIFWLHLWTKYIFVSLQMGQVLSHSAWNQEQKQKRVQYSKL